MDFFNKAKESLTNAGKDLTQKASDAGGLAKVTMRLHDLEKNYSEQLKKFAETMYSQHYNESKTLCPDIIYALDQNRKEFEAAKREQATLKGMKICPNCGAEQAKITVRCTACGINMADAEKVLMTQPEQEHVFCKNCGQEIPDGARFCMACGTPRD